MYPYFITNLATFSANKPILDVISDRTLLSQDNFMSTSRIILSKRFLSFTRKSLLFNEINFLFRQII